MFWLVSLLEASLFPTSECIISHVERGIIGFILGFLAEATLFSVFHAMKKARQAGKSSKCILSICSFNMKLNLIKFHVCRSTFQPFIIRDLPFLLMNSIPLGRYKRAQCLLFGELFCSTRIEKTVLGSICLSACSAFWMKHFIER